MCIIALKPEKVQFSRAQLKIMWDNNPDGAGFMYAEDGVVKIVKGLMTLDALENAINEVGPLRKLVIHFRIRTHGAISKELTHPFWITENSLGMVHNGVIRNLVNQTSEAESDTAVFARSFADAYVSPLQAIRNPFHRDMLEAYIGFSKMVFLDSKGRHYILNESLGTWENNVWYSNDRFKPDLPRVSGNTRVIYPVTQAASYSREQRQLELEQAFDGLEYKSRTDRSSGSRRGNRSSGVVHVSRGSENTRRRQKALLGCPTTRLSESYWDSQDFPGAEYPVED